MTEVKQVIVTIKQPKPGFPGQVAYGHYTVVDDLLTMTDQQGGPAESIEGKRYTRKLAPGEDPRPVARRLTKEIRLALRGDTSAPKAGFGEKLVYPRLGKI
jgi:hypothetical protein